MCEKQERRDGFRPRVWRYRWNTLGQLVAVQTPEQRQWRYVYDALGRRLRKFEVIPGQTALPLPMSQAPPTTPAPHSATAQKIIGYDYFWCGDQLVEEIPLYADGTPAYEQSTHWFYQPEQLAPFARYQRGELHYVITDHLGTPKELLNEWGNLDWAGRHDVWGKYRPWPAANDDPLISCPFRFPGQYEDNESGLHYNRYRYYDPDTAQYISTDPIGLAGGVNPYSYVHNPLSWVDPLGLTCKPTKGNGKLTEPELPPKVVAKQGDVEIVHYTRSGDHGPAHLHVKGGGAETKIGQAGKPIKGSPPLTSKQQVVVDANKSTIRKTVDKIQRWFRFQNAD